MDMQLRTDYREWMKETLKERVENNPAYSLRAFARDLKLSPASISLILNGRKGLSKPSAERVARSMGLTPTEQEYFKALVLVKHARTEAGKEMAKAKLGHLVLTKQKHSLEADQFQVIANWYHFGILQLTHLKNFRSDVTWIARQLDIPESDTRDAIARLKRLKLLAQGAAGRYSAVQDIVFTPDNIPSEALRKFHRQLIEKSLRAMHEQPIEQRTFISTEIPIKREEYKKVAAKIRRFNEEIIQKHSTSAGDGDAVYAITFQFFQLNKDEK